MNLYFRLFYVLLSSLGRPSLHPCEPITRTFRVLPWDIDAFLHMNNGRYSQIMDVARVDWMRRTRVLDAILKRRISGLLGGTIIRFRRALKPFQKYQVCTQLLCWDERWCYFEHRFETMGGKLVAIGFSRAGLRKEADWVHLSNMVQVVCPGTISPPMPTRIANWMEAEGIMADFHSNKHKPNRAGQLEASEKIAAE